MPFAIDANGVGENVWNVPAAAPMGDYDLQFVTKDAKGDERTIFSSQSVRVDEYRLPTMRATVTGPKEPPVRPAAVPLSLFAGYLSGGPAGGLPVTIRTAFYQSWSPPEDYDGWDFGGMPVAEGTVSLDDSGNESSAPLPLARTLPLALGADGTAQTSIEIDQPIAEPTLMKVEMDYEDANGEVLTTSRRIRLFPSAIQLGVKTDGWLMRDSDLRLQFVALGIDGRPVAGQPVSVAVYQREIMDRTSAADRRFLCL